MMKPLQATECTPLCGDHNLKTVDGAELKFSGRMHRLLQGHGGLHNFMACHTFSMVLAYLFHLRESLYLCTKIKAGVRDEDVKQG